MLARTQPGDGVNHCRGATNKTKQQQGRAGILRRFRRAGKGPHNQLLLLFTSGLMEKELFSFPFSLSGSFIQQECLLPQLGTQSLTHI